MTTETVPDVRARIQRLLSCVTVTNIETGRRLEGLAKRGRIFAAARGYQNTLVEIRWNGVSPEAVREALDALRSAQ